MKYVALYRLNNDHDEVECGRIYLIDGQLDAHPTTNDTLWVMSRPALLEKDGNIRPVYINEPEAFLEALPQSYTGTYFSVSKVKDDDRPLEEILRNK